ncbi:hypothetical protein V1478_007121 [Vespula squamosa]|uniref:Uncharacterized protein n=1 Tax=Vespula squamosa TaxID=30214 RepID=A0ABD2B2C9_VESSQ
MNQRTFIINSNLQKENLIIILFRIIKINYLTYSKYPVHIRKCNDFRKDKKSVYELMIMKMA